MKYIPNILSVARGIFAVAILVLVTLLDPAQDRALFLLLPGLMFLLACVSDTVDGNLARKYHVISDFGKVADSVSDKILIVFTMLAFLNKGADGDLPLLYIALAVTLFRDFLITAMRTLAAKDGVVLAAEWPGKLKTVFQMIALCGYFLFIGTPYLFIAQILLGIATLLCILSGALYLSGFIKSKKGLQNGK